MLLCLVTWLWYVNHYLLYVFPAVLFVVSGGKKIRTVILLYCVIPTYDNITGHEVRHVFVSSIAVISIPWMLCLGIY